MEWNVESRWIACPEMLVPNSYSALIVLGSLYECESADRVDDRHCVDANDRPVTRDLELKMGINAP